MTDAWTDRLSDYVDDQLSRAERAAAEAHLAACGACAALVADLRRVRQAVRALPDVPPRADLWRGIAERIGPSAPRGRVPLLGRRIPLSVPQLAAAAALLMLAGGAVAWQWRAPAPPPLAAVFASPAAARPASTAYDAAVARLEAVLRERRDRLDAHTVRVLEESLLTIDRAILRAEGALVQDPDDLYLRQHVAETHQRKLDLLVRAAALTVS